MPSAPVISGITSTDATSSGVTIRWTTSEPADGTVEYGITTAYGSSASDPSFVTSHAFRLAGLLPATTYHFRVTSANPNGSSSSSDQVFTTLAAPSVTVDVSAGASTGPLPFLFRAGYVALNGYRHPQANGLDEKILGELLPGFTTIVVPTNEGTDLDGYKQRVTNGSLGIQANRAERVLAAGGRVLFALQFMPDWLSSPPACSFCPPSDYEVWRELVRFSVDHLVRQGFTGDAGVGFRVWDEADLPNFWQGTAAQFQRLYEVSAEAIREVDPTAPITFGVSAPDCAFLRDMIQFADASSLPLDLIIYHPFGGGTELPPFAADVDRIRGFLAEVSSNVDADLDETGDSAGRVDGSDLFLLGQAFGSAAGDPAYDLRADLDHDGSVDGGDLSLMAAVWGKSLLISTPIHTESWNTWREFGTKILPDGSLEESSAERDTEIAAAYIVRALIAKHDAGIEFQSLFADVDFLNTGANEFAGDWGMFTRNGVIKPSYNAYRALSILAGVEEGGQTPDRVAVAASSGAFVSGVAARTPDGATVRILLANYLPESPDLSAVLEITYGSAVDPFFDCTNACGGSADACFSNLPSELQPFFACLDESRDADRVRTCALQLPQPAQGEMLRAVDDHAFFLGQPAAVTVGFSGLVPGAVLLQEHVVDHDHSNSCTVNLATATDTTVACGGGGEIDNGIAAAQDPVALQAYVDGVNGSPAVALDRITRDLPITVGPSGTFQRQLVMAPQSVWLLEIER